MEGNIATSGPRSVLPVPRRKGRLRNRRSTLLCKANPQHNRQRPLARQITRLNPAVRLEIVQDSSDGPFDIERRSTAQLYREGADLNVFRPDIPSACAQPEQALRYRTTEPPRAPARGPLRGPRA